jgi:hypothetical protein
MDLVHPFKPGERAGAAPHVTEDSGLRRAHFHTCGEQAFGDSMVAECAFISCFFLGMEVAGSVRARLNAVTAPDAPVFIDKNDAIFGLERSPHRAHLNTGGIVALVAEFWDEEAAQNILVHGRLHHRLPAVDILNCDRSLFPNDIPFDPRTVEKGIARNIVFFFARLDAPSTSDALVDLNSHSVVML